MKIEISVQVVVKNGKNVSLNKSNVITKFRDKIGQSGLDFQYGRCIQNKYFTEKRN